jgi:hypothetical protein
VPACVQLLRQEILGTWLCRLRRLRRKEGGIG